MAKFENDLTSNVLTLTDGTKYEGRYLIGEDGKPRMDIATCGHCGFKWNDALMTTLTPAPSARCPNEYNHVYEEGKTKKHDASTILDRIVAIVKAAREETVTTSDDAADRDLDAFDAIASIIEEEDL